MAREISNSDDYIDSRDVIARLEELESEHQALVGAVESATECLETGDYLEGEKEERETELADAKAALDEWLESADGDELTALRSFAEDGSNSADDWDHGATLIRDSYFVEAMQELVQDIGDLPRDIPSYLEIDWDATARNLQADYSSVEFDGVTYWVR